jgi:ADP-ribose pyrophosphatase YjhB (NUDIX family)
MADGSESVADTIAAWADQLQSLARTGLFFTQNGYDRERYERIVAIAAEMAGLVTGRPVLEFRLRWAADMGYVTPRVGVGAAILDEQGALLLLQRPESGLWGLPVGFSEVNETPAEGIIREVREETGLIVRPSRLLGVYDCRGTMVLHHLYNIVFYCTVEGGTLTPTSEAPVAGYFQQAALPSLVPHHVGSVADAFAARHDGWAGAAFDI